jgi:membrane fusion protein, multidrug efflux system
MTESPNEKTPPPAETPANSSTPTSEAKPISEEKSKEKPEISPKENDEKANKPRSRALLWFTLAILLAGLLWFCYWYFYLQYHESTDDAYANGNLVNINSVISEAVIAFYADDTDFVREGDLLVQLDPTNYQLAYNRELATLASVTLQVRQLYDNVQTALASVESKRVALAKAKFDYGNRLSLRESNLQAVSNEDYVHSNQDFSSAQFDLQQALSQLEAAQAAAGNTPIEKHPQIEQQRESIRRAFYNLQHTSIFAPTTGYVAQRSVDVGEWVTPLVNLMAVIPTTYVWVDANFKETQLTKMRVGQPSVVWFDLYGSKVKYEGKVIGIASGSGSVFSLIPPQNATGNWIKIVQRLPVRISLDPEKTRDFPVRLGISAEVEVDVTNQDLPYLATTPPIKPVAKTNVFDIDWDGVNQLIDKIIRENLKKQPMQQSK